MIRIHLKPPLLAFTIICTAVALSPRRIQNNVSFLTCSIPRIVHQLNPSTGLSSSRPFPGSNTVNDNNGRTHVFRGRINHQPHEPQPEPIHSILAPQRPAIGLPRPIRHDNPTQRPPIPIHPPTGIQPPTRPHPRKTSQNAHPPPNTRIQRRAPKTLKMGLCKLPPQENEM